MGINASLTLADSKLSAKAQKLAAAKMGDRIDVREQQLREHHKQQGPQMAAQMNEYGLAVAVSAS